ncbi:hypothetical protein GCM10028784_29670 [Myceligenerans cantabricum]
MTEFNAAIGEAVKAWGVPGRQLVIRVTCAPDARSTLATCQFWSTTPQGDFEHRADIQVSGTETRLEVARALVAAAHGYPLTSSGEPRWRVDANGTTTYILDVHRGNQ